MLPNTNRVTSHLNFSTDTSAIKRASRALTDLQEELREAGVSSIAMARGADDAAASTGRLAAASGTASGGLATLQSQLVATTGATEALDANSGNLNDALNEMSDIEAGATIEALSDALNDIDDMDMAEALSMEDNVEEAEEFLDVMQELNDQELTEVLDFASSGGESGDIEQFLKRTRDDIKAIRDAQATIGRLDQLDEGQELIEKVSRKAGYKNSLDNYLDEEAATFSVDDLDMARSGIGGDGPFPFNFLREDTTIEDIIQSTEDEFKSNFTSEARSSTLFDEFEPEEIRKRAIKRLRETGYFNPLYGAEGNYLEGEFQAREFESDSPDASTRGRYVSRISGIEIDDTDDAEQGVFNVLAEAAEKFDDATIEDALSMDDNTIESAFKATQTDENDSIDAGDIRSIIATRINKDSKGALTMSPQEVSNAENIDTDPFKQTPRSLFGDDLNELSDEGVEVENKVKKAFDQFDIDNVADIFNLGQKEQIELIENTALSDVFDGPLDLKETVLTELAKKGEIDADPANIGNNSTFSEIADNQAEEIFTNTFQIPSSSNTDMLDPREGDMAVEQMKRIAKLMDESEVIADAVLGADNLGDAINQLNDTDPAKMKRFVRFAQENTEDLQQFINSFAKPGLTGENLPDDVDDLSAMIREGFDGPLLRPSDDPERVVDQVGISEYQSRVLARAVGEIDRSMIGGGGGLGGPENAGRSGDNPDMPITYESLFMMLQQEMLDSNGPNSSRYKGSKDLMELLTAGQLTDLGFLETPEGKQTIEQILESELPDDMLDMGLDGFEGDASVQSLVANAIADEERSRDDTGLLFDYLNPDSSSKIGRPVTKALSDTDVDDGTIERVTDTLDEQMPYIYRSMATQLTPALAMTSEYDSEDMETLLPPKEVQQFMLSESSGKGAAEFNEALQSYFNDLDRNMSRMQKIQESKKLLLGTSPSDVGLDRLLGDPDNPRKFDGERGIYGGALRPVSQLLSAAGMDTPKDDVRLLKAFRRVEEGLRETLPFLDATSLNLGPLNVSFDNTIKMAYKLTATLGPLITTLLGLAGAAATAGAALGGLLLAGGINFFEEMEDTMAGVNNKGEAMQQTMGTIKDMALEALDPLREVRVGGTGASQFFVGAIRGSLVLLNRFAEIMSTVLQRDSVLKVIEQLSDFVYDRSGDDTFAAQLGQALDRILPILSRIGSALTGVGGALEFYTYIGAKLLDQFIDTLSDLGPTLKMITAYSAGFFYMLLMGLEYIGKLLNLLFMLGSAFMELVNILPYVNAEGRDVMMLLGAVAGTGYLVSGALSLLVTKGIAFAGILGGISRMLGYVVPALYSYATGLNYANMSTMALARSTLVLAGHIMAVASMYNAIANLNEGLTPLWDIPDWAAYAQLVTTTAIFVARLASALGLASSMWSALGAMAAPLIMAAKWVAGIAAVFLSIKSILIGGLIIGAASLIEYLITGESTLANWAMEFEVVRDIVAEIKDMIAWIDQKLSASSYGGISDDSYISGAMQGIRNGMPLSAPAGMIGLDTGGYLKSSGLAMLHKGEQVLSEGDVNRGAGVGGGSPTINVRMENNGAIGMRQMDRWIEEKFDELFRQRGTPEF